MPIKPGLKNGTGLKFTKYDQDQIILFHVYHVYGLL